MPKTPAFEGKTHIVAILDRSGSMAHLAQETISGYNDWLKTTKKAFKGQDVVFTLHLFDDRHEYPAISAKLADVPPLGPETYFARGFTALLDAVGKTLTETKKAVGKNDRALALVMTDGYENASREYSQAQVKKLIEGLTKKGNWTIDYLGANQDAFTVGGGMGMGSTVSTQYTRSGTQAAWTSNKLRTAGMAVNSGRAMASRSQTEYDGLVAEEEAKEEAKK